MFTPNPQKIVHWNRVSSLFSYLGHHGPELDSGGEEERDEEDVVGGESGAPLPEGPDVEAHRRHRRHQDQQEQDRPLVAAENKTMTALLS